VVEEVEAPVGLRAKDAATIRITVEAMHLIAVFVRAHTHFFEMK
jgi:hypothetical protein